VHGWESVKEALERAASFYEEGMHSFENVMKYETSELAYLIEIEKFKAKLGRQAEMSTGSLRVTSIFRKEDGVWKVVQRHADPLTSTQASYKVNS
jgi:ketosteroid isomerase-like protein